MQLVVNLGTLQIRTNLFLKTMSIGFCGNCQMIGLWFKRFLFLKRIKLVGPKASTALTETFDLKVSLVPFASKVEKRS